MHLFFAFVDKFFILCYNSKTKFKGVVMKPFASECLETLQTSDVTRENKKKLIKGYIEYIEKCIEQHDENGIYQTETCILASGIGAITGFCVATEKVNAGPALAAASAILGGVLGAGAAIVAKIAKRHSLETELYQLSIIKEAYNRYCEQHPDEDEMMDEETTAKPISDIMFV